MTERHTHRAVSVKSVDKTESLILMRDFKLWSSTLLLFIFARLHVRNLRDFQIIAKFKGREKRFRETRSREI